MKNDAAAKWLKKAEQETTTQRITDVPRRRASLTQADIARAIRAAKQAGAAEVEVRVGNSSIIVRIAPSTGAETPLKRSRGSSCD